MGQDDDDDELLRAVADAPALAPPEPALPAGERLGRFRIIAKVGAGGMGVVYRAEDEELKREVALKVIGPALEHDSRGRRRLLREARAAAAVSHPNVATVFDVGEDGGRVFIAMELASGETLRSVLAKRRLEVNEALDIARQIARGLAKAHEKGIVHRDLKPDNVMVGEIVKVLDFGLARIDDKTNESASTATEPGIVAGTPGYMSPEQVTGGVVDARSDVFAFGVVLYEMLAGVRPFERQAKLATAVSIARDAHAPLSSKRRDIPAHVARLVDKCLAKDPGGRYADARELLHDLDRSTMAKPRRSLAVALSAVVIGAGIIGVLASRRATDAPPPERPPTISTQESTTPPAVASSTSVTAARSLEPPVGGASAPKPAVRHVPPPTPSTSASRRKRDPLADQY